MIWRLVFLLSLQVAGQPWAEYGAQAGVPRPPLNAGADLREESPPPPSTKIFWSVPVATQTTSYSCGAAAMQGLLAFYGHSFTEQTLMKEMGSNPKEGTDHNRMAEFSNKIGVKAQVKHNLKLADLSAALEKGNPVIIECQAHDDRPKKDYSNIWEAGHYMVVIGMDDKNLYFMDPSSGGSRGYIPVDEFVVRWHDLGHHNEKLYYTAIFFEATPNPVGLPLVWEKVP